MGFFGVLIPVEYGGLSLDVKAYELITEELSRGWLSVGSITARGQSLAGATEGDARRRRCPIMVHGRCSLMDGGLHLVMLIRILPYRALERLKQGEQSVFPGHLVERHLNRRPDL